jgi:hypothetical protein
MIRNFAGLLGLVALLAATVIGMLVVAGFIAPGSPERGPQFINVREAEKKVERDVIDETLETGDVSWTIHEAKLTNKISTYTFPPTTRTGAFIEITFTAENISDIPVTLKGESVALVGPEGQEDLANADTNAKFVRPELNLLFSEHGLIAPGESKEGKVYFDLDVPFGVESVDEVSGFEAHFKGTDPTTVNAETIALEFSESP